MMKKETPPNPSPTDPFSQPPVSASTPTSAGRSKILIFSILGIIIITGSVLIGFQIGKNKVLNQESITTPAQTTPGQTTNLPAEWKTYTNQVLRYTINYPSNWTLDSSKAESSLNTVNSQKLTIYKGEYELTILWPSAFSPTVCLFDDDAGPGFSESTQYCRGKYVEFTSEDGTTYRRLVEPETTNDNKFWFVWTKTKREAYFVSNLPISYFAPLDYEENQIELMDQILSTLKFTETDFTSGWETYSNT